MCMKEGLKKASQVASKGSSDEIRVTYFCQLFLLSRSSISRKPGLLDVKF